MEDQKTFGALFNDACDLSKDYGEIHSRIKQVSALPKKERPAAIKALKNDFIVLQNCLAGLLRVAESEVTE